MSLSKLKRNRDENTKRLNDELEKAKSGKSFQDDRFWYPERDKLGNGYAVIRFMPGYNDGEDPTWVSYFYHSFKGPTGLWYIENCRTTLDLPDPVIEYNNELWKFGKDSPQAKQASIQKRKLTYVSNIYVVEDPAKPENEGKVFLFKYGKQIWDKLYLANNPPSPNIAEVDPFDLWGRGANFRLIVRKADGQTNYDQSTFMDPASLSDDESFLEKIYSQCYDLKELVSKDKFKSYDDLQSRLDLVLGRRKVATSPVTEMEKVRVVEDDVNGPIERINDRVTEKQTTPGVSFLSEEMKSMDVTENMEEPFGDGRPEDAPATREEWTDDEIPDISDESDIAFFENLE